MTGQRSYGRSAWLILIAWITLVLPTIATAQPAQPTAAANIAAALTAETGTPAPGRSTMIAITMRPASTWHGYWVNGGDAGFGMTVNWELPRGVTIGDLRYPVPQTLIIGGLMNHVYERPYALLAPLTVDASIAPGTRLSIIGNARWLACTDQVCVPESGRLTLNLVAGDGAIDGAEQAQFDSWRAALPPPLGSAATYQVMGERIRIAVPLPATLTLDAPHLFVATGRAIRPATLQRFFRDGDRLIIESDAGDAINELTQIDAVLRIGTDRGLSLVATPGIVPPGGTPIADNAPNPDGALDTGLLVTAILGALIGGLILNIMPCVFPILSLKALALARGGGDAAAVRAEGLAYTAGAVLVCLALGTILLLLRAGGESVGWAFQLQRPESVLLLILLMATITANLIGLFDFGQVGIGQKLADAGGTRGALATGALAAFIATPCSGPFLGAALGATLVLPGWAALPIFGALGLGLALPFLAIALIPALRNRLPRPGPWMVTLRRWLAIPMALTVAALIWLLAQQVGVTGWLIGSIAVVATAILTWFAGRQQRSGESGSPAFFMLAAMLVPLALLLPAPGTVPAPAVERGLLDAAPWSAARVDALRADNRGPVFVYFTADWCISCKVNEASSIERDDTAAAFRAAGVRTLVGDWTNGDAAITRALAAHGRNSVPLYLWYPADGGAPEILPQLLTPAMLIERANNAAAD